MARNIEIKAHVESVEAIGPGAATIATAGPIEIDQDDTFFACKSGRLKLRTFSNDRGELIFYRRPNERGPKESFYVRSPTSAPDVLREALTLAHGQIGRVRKHRTLYMAGRTRIHLDRVEGLGDFLELEVVLTEGEGSDGGLSEAYAMLEALAVERSQLVGVAYTDLLAQQASA
jgi:predicted adenylyl cyclase CyaB